MYANEYYLAHYVCKWAGLYISGCKTRLVTQFSELHLIVGHILFNKQNKSIMDTIEMPSKQVKSQGRKLDHSEAEEQFCRNMGKLVGMSWKLKNVDLKFLEKYNSMLEDMLKDLDSPAH